jgi:hypothetical protein
MQATRYHDSNPKLKINTVVSGTAAPPEVVFKFADDSEVRPRLNVLAEFMKWNVRKYGTASSDPLVRSDTNCYFGSHFSPRCALFPQKRFDSQNFKANEILFDVHLFLDRLDNEYEMAGKSLDD